MLTNDDLLQIKEKGITNEQILEQIELFKKGFPFLNVVSPAIPGNGLLRLDKTEVKEYAYYFNKSASGKQIIKFVPASGAATRMFKSLFEFLSDHETAEVASDVTMVMENLQKFAFYIDLKEAATNAGKDLDALVHTKQWKEITELLLNQKGLNYGNLPKGLLKFHKYSGHNRTPVEEHIVEGALYTSCTERKVNIHFTVSPEHIESFNKLIEKVVPYYEKKFRLQFQIGFSIQKPSTDTIAVDKNNVPFREKSGKLIFRPGGHGALLENLNDLDADLIFIKNIDNVVPDELKEDTVLYKKALAGLLLQIQSKIFQYIKLLQQPNFQTLENEIKTFISKNLGYRFSKKYDSLSEAERKAFIKAILHRPIRVCGMVKNTGEPGGGPFWVEDRDGVQSLQILESSQFNFADIKQQEIFTNATHFNPVDLVIATRDDTGKKYDLHQFRNAETGFISIKSKDGKELKAQELPGLWNGAMAYWNTVFVEVPITTFNPVKTILDLLRKEHLNEL
jgi:hypothetical protein